MGHRGAAAGRYLALSGSPWNCRRATTHGAPSRMNTLASSPNDAANSTYQAGATGEPAA